MVLSQKSYGISPELFKFFVTLGNILKFDIRKHLESFKGKHIVQQ